MAGGLVGACVLVGPPAPPVASAAEGATSATTAAKQSYPGAVGSVLPSKKEVTYLTQEWEGKRDSTGRPIVPDDVVKRLEKVTVEQAWGYLQGEGYTEQFAGGFKILKPKQAMVGRAMTAQYMPSSPQLEGRMTELGHAAGYDGHMNTWPLQMLANGDVYVADGFGKMKDGTLIGGNLGQDIYDKTGNGVVFEGSARDREELAQIDGFNAFVRGWHPSYILDMMLSDVNSPIRIGTATVLPGDVVLAKRDGVVFIPSFMAEDLARDAEETTVRDLFAKAMVADGTYTSGELDKEWTPEIEADFVAWLKENRDDLPIPPERVDEIIQEYSSN